MPKTCEAPECSYNQFGGGYCRNHQWMRKDKKPLKEKKAYKINAESKKKEIENREYNKLARIFKFDNPVCKVNAEGCTGRTTEVHHKKGRGKYLLVVSTWLPCCHNCHHKIEMNPVWAKENGFSISRLNDEI